MRYPQRHYQPDELGYNFERYLSAKQAIDDAALNRRVLDELAAHLPRTSRTAPLRVLELGSGIGSMVERMMGWELLKFADYTAVDADEDLTRSAHSRLKRWSLDCGFKTDENSPRMLDVRSSGGRISITFECADAYQYFERHCGKRQWDLGMAHAFMDLVDLAEIIPYFFQLIKPGGLVYLALNYDAETILLPIIDRRFDEEIFRLYNESMDTRTIHGKKAGDSRTGRHLLLHLSNSGADILAAGSSDWIVFPRSKRYQENESYFLHFIIHTIFEELKGHDSLEPGRFDAWVARRHAQIKKGELIFIAKQMDLLARIPET